MRHDLKPADAAFEAILRGVVAEHCFRDCEDKYLSEPRGMIQGREGLLLAPKTTRDVSAIVTACYHSQVGIIPYGGGTGLVGGQVAVDIPRPVILTLERLNAILDIDTIGNVITTEAGVVLANLQAAAASENRLFPLSLAAEGTCQIGGNLSTNAGGVGVLRYGNVRELCLGLEAVLPDGTIWNGLSCLKKDNTGYDLKNLLIGAEGSLGVITAASLKIFPESQNRIAAFLEIKDPEAALTLLKRCCSRLPDMVSAFELIHRQGLEFLAEKLPQIRLSFKKPGEWMALIDLGFSAENDVENRLESLLAGAVEDGLVTDALISQNAAQRQVFWDVRESIPEANRLIGAICSHDISVPVAKIPEFIRQAHSQISPMGDLRINCFGHVGDGNLHYNIYPPKGQARGDFMHLKDEIKQAVYGLATSLGGAISAEHGIGRLKCEDLVRYGNPAKLSAMRAIKLALDPCGIMNPGAVIGLN